MHLPNYRDGSIVNLMSSIRNALGDRSAIYDELRLLPSKELKDAKNIVLIVIDGLGYTFLEKQAKGTVFRKGLKGAMTSVFPATTASAITTFATGAAPQQHAFTGWFMHLKEIGVVFTTLLFNPRFGGPALSTNGFTVQQVLKAKGISERLKACSYLVTARSIMNSDFTQAISGSSKRVGCNTLNDFFMQMEKSIRSHNRKKFIFAYWPEFDSIAHKNGIGSKQAKKHYDELCRSLERFLKQIMDTKTTLIITSDHGLIDTTKDRMIQLEEHPELLDCLTLPLCGEPRAAYCYVHPSKAERFEAYVKTKLKKYCSLHKSQDLIDKNIFGLSEPDPSLFDRVGDYVLIMKENYIIKDMILKKERDFHIGNHGGVSRDEMIVPLIVFQP
ncbi:alkaline phosphatase family protein [Candidatus Woesearchaeota archaeon]|nr:alkaline phosphatase family protein [Candidatus Woesearchaeota archaeon]